MISQTTVQPKQVIIISSICYLAGIILWGFSYHICVIDCWTVCYYLSDKCSLVLKLVLMRVSKFSVSRIQTGHTDLLPPQVCVRSWQGCRLGVQNCSLQCIDLIDLKYPSRYLFNPYFVGGWLVCFIFIESVLVDPKTCPRVC